MNIGTIRSISFAGVSFSVPDDQEIIISLGGLVATESITYGDGKTRGSKKFVPGKISQVNIDVTDDDLYNSLLDSAAQKSVDVAVTDVGGDSYGGAGVIISDDEGLERNAKTGKLNADFMVKAISGKFTKL